VAAIDFQPLPGFEIGAQRVPARDLVLSSFHVERRDVEELLAERGIDVSHETMCSAA